MQKNYGKYLTILIGLVVSAGAIYYVSKDINWDLVLGELRKTNRIQLITFTVIFVISFYLRAVRWKFLIPKNESWSEITTTLLLKSLFIGNLGTYLLPLRAGEFIRPYIVSRRGYLNWTQAFASIVTERVFDILAMSVMFSMLGAVGVPNWVYYAAETLKYLSIILVCGIIFSYCAHDKLLKITRKIFSVFFPQKITDKLVNFGDGLLSGLKGISSFTDLFIVAVLSLIVWGLYALTFQSGLWLFSQYPDFKVGMTLTVMVALAVSAPGAPGFLGTFQVGCVLALCDVYGYSKEYALAYALVIHFLQFSLSILFGFIALFSEGLSFSEITNVKGNK